MIGDVCVLMVASCDGEPSDDVPPGDEPSGYEPGDEPPSDDEPGDEPLGHDEPPGKEDSDDEPPSSDEPVRSLLNWACICCIARQYMSTAMCVQTNIHNIVQLCLLNMAGEGWGVVTWH